MHALFLLCSSRRDGNSEQLARAAATSLPLDSSQTWLRMTELVLPPFVDLRSVGGPWPEPTGNARVLLDATLAATDLIFATPTYWYSLPAAPKLYLDHWSNWIRLPGLDFKRRMAGKRLWVITVNSDDPSADDSSEPLISALRLSARYLDMQFARTLIGHGNLPGDVLKDQHAMERARTFFAG